ncbi:DUF6232 family protein [Chitinophaga sp. S165]|uniref:DUF6232 family protein n=1 Tax=Chitinophaga sp. S165 TaxID=2135462 RepID=UPI000D71106F|nr:DUF6232 family protein [Chitinophaga sp. S165]PWV50384.1 hypothetical protein C7475_1044 [Chitinophaga sp. S165]
MKDNSGGANSPYHGTLVFTNNTLSFNGTTIQLRNITRFTTYEVQRPHLIPPVFLIISTLVFLISFSWKGAFIITIFVGAIAGYGFYEYFRRKLYAILIELNSSSHYAFSSVDKDGISKVCERLNDAMTSDKPINTTITFHSDKIIFGDHIARDKYEFNNSNIDNAGSFDNNPKSPL